MGLFVPLLPCLPFSSIQVAISRRFLPNPAQGFFLLESLFFPLSLFLLRGQAPTKSTAAPVIFKTAWKASKLLVWDHIYLSSNLWTINIVKTMEVSLLHFETIPLGLTGQGFSSTMKINGTYFSSYACTKRWSRMCSSGSQVLYLQQNRCTSPAFVILPKIHLHHFLTQTENKILCSDRAQLLTWEAILSTWADTPHFPVGSRGHFINTTYKNITSFN